MTITRARVVDAVVHELDARGTKATSDPLSTARGVADRLGLRRDVVSEPPPSAPALDYGVWLDDPPKVLHRHLDRLLTLPLTYVAVMADGPRPGLSDARWTPEDLAELALVLPPTVRRVLTVWAAADRDSIAELRARLPEMVHALGAHGVEVDAEPVGEWSAADARAGGYPRLSDAAEDLADAMVSAVEGAREATVEATTFPGALRHVRPLLAALAARAPSHVAVRYLSQSYAVRHRSGREVDWTGALGPVRLPEDSIRAARSQLPERVEVCYGRAVYDDQWPQGRSSIVTGTQAALRAGATTVRDWSGKWLTRMKGHERRRELVLRAHEAADDLIPVLAGVD